MPLLKLKNKEIDFGSKSFISNSFILPKIHTKSSTKFNPGQISRLPSLTNLNKDFVIVNKKANKDKLDKLDHGPVFFSFVNRNHYYYNCPPLISKSGKFQRKSKRYSSIIIKE